LVKLLIPVWPDLEQEIAMSMELEDYITLTSIFIVDDFPAKPMI